MKTEQVNHPSHYNSHPAGIECIDMPNGALYSPCDNCDLIEVCYDDWRHPDTSVCHDLCRLHQAKTNEYYREMGVAKCSPRFGTVEVVDEHKEMQLELKRLEEDLTMTKPTDMMILHRIDSITVGRGNPAWGAPEDRDVFIIRHHKETTE